MDGSSRTIQAAQANETSAICLFPFACLIFSRLLINDPACLLHSFAACFIMGITLIVRCFDVLGYYGRISYWILDVIYDSCSGAGIAGFISIIACWFELFLDSEDSATLQALQASWRWKYGVVAVQVRFGGRRKEEKETPARAKGN